MAAFKAGATRIVVATTVIEVGVDVPDASIMVIEHAENFGLTQLHQLRGRVGRGSRPSSCVLLYRAPLGETAKARLAVMRETEDGFRIAEEDLRLRGEGDLLGTKQSGLPGFRIARLDVHGDLLEIARDDARLVIARDPELAGPRGAALRTLLYLFWPGRRGTAAEVRLSGPTPRPASGAPPPAASPRSGSPPPGSPGDRPPAQRCRPRPRASWRPRPAC